MTTTSSLAKEWQTPSPVLTPGLAELLRFHHIGLAVSDPLTAFRFLAVQGYTEGNQVFDPRQKVNLAMRHHRVMPDFEVIWPGHDPSPIDAMIKRHGTLMYHCCYETCSVETVVGELEREGFDVSLVSPPKPALLFDGRAVSFHLVNDFGLIELLTDGP